MWIHRNVDTCQIDYSIHSKLRIFHYSEVINRSTHSRKKKSKDFRKMITIKFDVFVLSFLFSNDPDNKYHKHKWCMLYFTCIKLVACINFEKRLISYIYFLALLFKPLKVSRLDFKKQYTSNLWHQSAFAQMTKSGSELKYVCSKENSLPQTENFVGFVKCFSELAKGIYETCKCNFFNLPVVIVVVFSIVQLILFLCFARRN